MQLVATPSYRDIFKEEAPEISSLIADVPSKVIIGFFSAINAELYLSPHSKATQIKIFQSLTRRFNKQQQDIVFEGIYPFLQKHPDPVIFALWYVTEFMMYELSNYRDLVLPVDTTPEQEFRIFKAYMIIVEQVNDRHNKLFKEKGESIKKSGYVFQALTWPMVIGQFEFNNKPDPMYQAAKSYVMLDYLEKNVKTSIYVKNFLQIVGRPHIWQYIWDILTLVQISFANNPEKEFKNFSIEGGPEFDSLLESLTIDVKEFQKHSRKNIDFIGMREKPLFKIENSKYTVMNWSYLYNQIYMGLLFDFYKRSGISKIFPQFPDFKSFISTNVSEEILFKGILKKALTNKHSITAFDDRTSSGFPDCYHRERKYAMLLEFKDAFMPGNAISSADYAIIKADIDSKFISNSEGSNKGIRQLLENIKQINENNFKAEDFEKNGVKRRNLVVYPVIVYTHYMYSMAGINDYLNKVLKKELADYAAQHDLVVRVEDLVMIDFEFFYRNLLLLKDRKIDLKDLIDKYNSEIQRRKKREMRMPGAEAGLKANSSFEEIYLDFIPEALTPRNKNYVKELFDALNIVPVDTTVKEPEVNS